MTDIPSNREFEEALLAAILRDNAALDSVGWLDPQHLFDAQLREFFIAARDLRQQGRPINYRHAARLDGRAARKVPRQDPTQTTQPKFSHPPDQSRNRQVGVTCDIDGDASVTAPTGTRPGN